MVAISVLGTGYVGLSTGACLAHLGHTVTCLDIDQRKINALSQGIVEIVEEGLESLVKSGLEASRLSFSTNVREGLSTSELVFLCLPTPQGGDGAADLSYIWGVVEILGECLQPSAVVVNKSTVPVGTARELGERLGREDIVVVSNPEFLRQGSAIKDFLHPTRVVIGGDDSRAVNLVADLYKDVDAPILRMAVESAETLKYAANSLLATKLTFINAIADICEVVGADIFDVAEGIGLDPRIGGEMLNAGPGWGGSCFPKDTRALVNIAAKRGYDFSLLRGVIETNDHHYARIADKVFALCGGSIEELTIAAWGLTFKAGTDDLRDSPAIKILSLLHEAGAIVRAFDPTAKGGYASLPWIEVVPTALSACEGAHVLTVLTEWPEFREVDPGQVAMKLVTPRVVDGRNVLDREVWRSAGFEYLGVGR